MNKNKELLYAIILTVFPIVLFFILNIPECEYFLIELFKITAVPYIFEIVIFVLLFELALIVF